MITLLYPIPSRKFTHLAIAIFSMIFLQCCGQNYKSKTALTIEDKKPTSFIKDIEALEFKQLIDAGNGIILDVRTPQEYETEHIQGSSLININEESFVEKINLINKEKEIYVYCRSGSRSKMASQILNENGFEKVYNLKNGIFGWKDNGYPIEESAIAIDDHIQSLTLEDFSKMLKTDQTVLVDFHTVWCAPCRKMAPIIDQLESKYKGKTVVMRIDADKSKDIAKTYDIKGVPVFIIFKGGKEIWRHTGIIAQSELITQLDKVR